MFRTGYPAPFATKALAEEWIEKSGVRHAFPGVIVEWLGFEYDVIEGIYAIRHPHGGYLSSPWDDYDLNRSAEDDQAEWEAQVRTRTREENLEILEWLDSPDGDGGAWPEAPRYLKQITMEMLYG